MLQHVSSIPFPRCTLIPTRLYRRLLNNSCETYGIIKGIIQGIIQVRHSLSKYQIGKGPELSILAGSLWRTRLGLKHQFLLKGWMTQERFDKLMFWLNTLIKEIIF